MSHCSQGMRGKGGLWKMMKLLSSGPVLPFPVFSSTQKSIQMCSLCFRRGCHFGNTAQRLDLHPPKIDVLGTNKIDTLSLFFLHCARENLSRLQVHNSRYTTQNTLHTDMNVSTRKRCAVVKINNSGACLIDSVPVWKTKKTHLYQSFPAVSGPLPNGSKMTS